MAKNLKQQLVSDDQKQTQEEELITAALEILNTRSSFRLLGVDQKEVDYLRRSDLTLRSALYILFHAGKLKL